MKMEALRKRTVRWTIPVTCLLLAAVLSGCSLDVRDRPASDKENGHDQIARDFIHALRQLDGFEARSTTIGFLRSNADDPFVRSVEKRLRSLGYAIRTVDEDAGRILFQYRLSTAPPIADARSRDTYELAIGPVQMRREYSVLRSGLVRPLSPLYVRGADASTITLDDSIFGDDNKSVSRNESRVRPPAVPLAESTSRPVATASATPGKRLPGELIPKPDRLAGSSARSRLAGLRATDLNVFDIGGSNFGKLFAQYEDIDESVLIFGDDSLRLGRSNKSRVVAMVRRFDPKRDVFSVVGCSLGTTRVVGGNAALALGRAGRVREALLIAGVDSDRILDEGCWAETPDGEALPRRGVVLTHMRRMD